MNIDNLKKFVASRIRPSEIHGMSHLERVERNGRKIAACYPEANLNIIVAFAYLHDACRESDNHDPGHGPRAALLVDQIRHSILTTLSDEEIGELKTACRLHTSTHRTGNLNVDICFDADRLDLGRVGIMPDPEKMATQAGAQLAANL